MQTCEDFIEKEGVLFRVGVTSIKMKMYYRYGGYFA